MARDYLSIMASSSPLEGEFSKVSDVTIPKRNRLTKRRINEVSCIKSWNMIIDKELPIEEQESDDSDFNGEELINEEDVNRPLSPKSPITRRPKRAPIVISDNENSGADDMYGGAESEKED
jgi:hypothetical protein